MQKEYKNEIRCDLYRLTRKTGFKAFLSAFFGSRIFRRTVYYRYYNKSGKLGKYIVHFFNHFLIKKMSVEIPYTAKIGEGILFLHPYGITLNSGTVIGKNCTILKGATIGNSKTNNAGTPTIGDNVYIGLNSTVIGNVNIGNNVLIAANTFVNFDVPDGALVLGCPGTIHPKENASQKYIVNSIDELLQQF